MIIHANIDPTVCISPAFPALVNYIDKLATSGITVY